MPSKVEHATSSLAAEITFNASRQTAWTIQALVPRARRDDAFRAYAYFRWLDDILDGEGLSQTERKAFLRSQIELLHRCRRRPPSSTTCREEWMLVELTQGRLRNDPGLWIYLQDMMAVMAFDAQRRYRRISEHELHEYSRRLATAVTEAVYTFIADRCDAPRTAQRYLAADAAHMIHMLRDMHEDLKAGYINIPSEILPTKRVRPHDLSKPQVKAWVRSRIQTARSYFEQGEAYLCQIGVLRCRLAGILYGLRFEGVMGAIEREGYLLRPDYSDCMDLRYAVRSLPRAARMLVIPQNGMEPGLTPSHYASIEGQHFTDHALPASKEPVEELL